MNKVRILKDSREQQGWFWAGDSTFAGTAISTLKTGDYTLEGHQDNFIIERKGCLAEFAGNIFQKRFINEMERLEGFTHPFIILEFSMDDILNFPQSTNIPCHKRRFLKVNPYLILKRLIEFQLQFKTKIILAGKYNGKKVATSIFKRILDAAKTKTNTR